MYSHLSICAQYFYFFPKQKKLLIHIILVKQKITLDVHEMQQNMIYSQLDLFLRISRSFETKF